MYYFRDSERTAIKTTYKLLQQICEEYTENCYDCPFSYPFSARCMVNRPFEWKLPEELRRDPDA